MPKKPFDINLAIQRIRKAVEAFPKAAMFQLYEEGYRTTFEQLVACIISIRTYDEVTIPTAKRLFALARTPEQIARLTPQQIDVNAPGGPYSTALQAASHLGERGIVGMLLERGADVNANGSTGTFAALRLSI